MQYSQNKQFQQTSATEYPAPPQQIYATSGGGAIIVIGNLLLAGVIIYVTSRNGEAAPMGILAGAACFGLITPVSLMSLNGGIPECIRAIAELIRYWQEQVTARQQIHYQVLLEERERAEQWRVVGEQAQLSDTHPTDPVQLGTRYIPAVPRITDAIKLDASNFITQLFDADTGRPLPTKITRNKGQIQHKSPEPATVEYLMSLGIVRTGEGNQLYFDTATYPTHRDALNALRTGVRPLPWQGGKEEGGTQ